MMKKFFMALAVAAMVFVGTASPVSAASGWQTLVTFPIDNFNSSVPNYRTSGIIYEQDGGNIGAKITNHSVTTNTFGIRAQMLIHVYEDDGATGDDYLGYMIYLPNYMDTEILSMNISDYRDGVNGRAELYFKIEANYGATKFFVSALD